MAVPSLGLGHDASLRRASPPRRQRRAGDDSCEDEQTFRNIVQNGLSIWYKRLESGTFQLPASEQGGVELDATTLSMLLAGIDLTSARRRKRFRRVG